MPRLTLRDVRQSRLPRCIGACTDDTPTIADAVNAAQQRLVYAGEIEDEGWYGAWARTIFNVLWTDPYITLPRSAGRMIVSAVCKMPIAVQNSFYEFLEFGGGIEPKFSCSGTGVSTSCCGVRAALDRGEYPAFRDLGGEGRTIRVRCLDTLDTGGNYRTLIQGTNAFDKVIYSQDGIIRVLGQYLTLTDPFVDMPFTINSLTGIQKDVTNGAVQYYDVDPATGDETLILTMEPSETVSGYRRYYLNGLPRSCCPVINDDDGNPTVQVEALVKLNLMPVSVDPDYLLIQNLEAIIAECQSARYSTMDIPSAKGMAMAAHKDAIRLLQGELAHYYGTDKPAVSFNPFGSAALSKQAIGSLM
jgi:hypothetical protein